MLFIMHKKSSPKPNINKPNRYWYLPERNDKFTSSGLCRILIRTTILHLECTLSLRISEKRRKILLEPLRMMVLLQTEDFACLASAKSAYLKRNWFVFNGNNYSKKGWLVTRSESFVKFATV